MTTITPKPVIAGTMAISNHPMAPTMVERLVPFCDYLVLRFDRNNRDDAIWEACMDKVKTVFNPLSRPFRRRGYIAFESDIIWGRWNWREELLRKLDPIGPDIVLTPDQDECFHDTFITDIRNLWESEYNFMLVDYDMVICPSVDQPRRNIVPKYPKGRHCKAFKWASDMTYQDYRGSAFPNYPGGESTKRYYEAANNIQHYCFYFKKWEKTHKRHN